MPMLPLIKTASHLYRISLLPVLPIAGLVGLMGVFMRFGGHFLQGKYAANHQQISVVLLIILPALLGLIFKIMDNIAKGHSFAYGQLFIFGCERFLSLIGCLLSMLLLPAITLGACIGIYFVLKINHFSSLFLLSWMGISVLILFAAFVKNIFAPLLVFTDQLDANSALDKSNMLTKGVFFSVYIISFLAILTLFLLAYLPSLVFHFFPHAVLNIPDILLSIFSTLFLIFFGPWAFAILLVTQYDMQCRHPL